MLRLGQFGWRMWVLSLISVAAAVGASPAQGQERGVESIRQGARVRLAFDGRRMSGVLTSRGPDTLWFRSGRADTLVGAPLAKLGRLEVSREQRSNAGRMALVGLLIGALPGVLAGVTCDCSNSAGATVVLGAFTGGIGAAIGAGLGATGRHDVWEDVR